MRWTALTPRSPRRKANERHEPQRVRGLRLLVREVRPQVAGIQGADCVRGVQVEVLEQATSPETEARQTTQGLKGEMR